MTAAAADVARALRERFLADLDATVAWYHREMPAYYLKVTTPAEQIRHLEVIHALLRQQEARLTMVDDADAGKLLFFGRPGTHLLLEVVNTLGARPFNRVELHTSADRRLYVHAVAYRAQPPPADVDLAGHRERIVDACCDDAGPCVPRELVLRYLDAVDQAYLARSTIERVVRHVRAWAGLAGGADVHVELDSLPGIGTRILVAVAGCGPDRALLHLARVVKRHDLHLRRGYVDRVPAPDGAGVPGQAAAEVVIASIYVAGADDQPLADGAAQAVADDLEALRRPYADGLAALYADGAYTLQQLELLRAAIAFASQLLASEHPFLDIAETGEEAVAADPSFGRTLFELLALRFAPHGSGDAAAFERLHADMLARARAVEPLARAVVLEAMLAFVAAVRLTNLWRSGRAGCAFRLDPAVLPEARFPHRPYGVFAFVGPAGRGFHIRFRASARGGLRLVLPRNMGQWQRARDGLLKEVYDLAWAQQLKNKDIPEGGSKCIGLVRPGGDVDGLVRQLVDALLDCILPPEAMPEVVGPYRAPREGDLVFLGPDENMTPARITWVAERARTRGLPHHATLMSSKPGTGINHKEYGVTSEGLFRWILMVLPLIGLGEDRPYTVKMTGGPDGDLGGNLLRILRREHAARCRVVAISDGTGFAHDPAGLDWVELVRLADAGQGIAAYAPACLRSTDGRVVAVTDAASERLRNTLHERVDADLFVPCGGRPYTINDGNWRAFLGADGRPSACAMVEGANIFITAAARQSLEDAGLLVIKDSSANKGGVICSSYEVLAGLVLADEEFLAVKPRYVAEVLDLLRARADAEGRALLAAWNRRGRGVRLSELSQQISEEINRLSGLFEPAIGAHLDDPAFAAAWRRHLHRHCPPLLVERFADRLDTRIPRAHRVAILAKRLASEMVYREGLTWCRGYVTADKAWDVLSTWLEAEDKVAVVLEAVRRLGVPDQDALMRMISAGSQRELVRERLGGEY